MPILTPDHIKAAIRECAGNKKKDLYTLLAARLWGITQRAASPSRVSKDGSAYATRAYRGVGRGVR